MTLPGFAMNASSFPLMYERFLVGPLFRPWAETLIDHARLQRGDRVLDVACGTGIVARVAKERLGETGGVVGVDVSPQMLAVAKAVAPQIEWREGNAQALPLADGERFDVVVCHQGLQFFPDKSAALDEMKRAVSPGGRTAVAVWRSLDDTPFVQELHQIAERRLGTIADRRHSFGDRAALEQVMTASGFIDVRVEALTRTIRFQDGAVFVRLNTMALVGMSQAASTLTEDERQRIVDAIVDDSAEVLQRYTDAQGLAFELDANVATARA